MENNDFGRLKQDEWDEDGQRNPGNAGGNGSPWSPEAWERDSGGVVNPANARAAAPEKPHDLELLSKQLRDALQAACLDGDPQGDLARKAVKVHREWLKNYWDKVEPEAHKGLARMYADDPRFNEYYEKVAPGCALLLRDAVEYYYRGCAGDQGGGPGRG